jgi:branched-chain amino acid transport system ATP-binding protein
VTGLLVVCGIEVVLGGMPVVRDVSLEVRRGEIVALLGRNGAGKTTTLRAVAGLHRIASGRVLLDGREVQNRPAHVVAGAGCTLVLEGARVFRRLTVEANLRLGAYGAGRVRTVHRLAEQYRRFPSLAARRMSPAGALSGGEQSLLAVAQGLMAAPRVLLLDEPSVGLDAGTLDVVMETLGELRQEGGAVLVAEQAVDRVLAVADRGYVLDAGRLVGDGEARALRSSAVLRDAYAVRSQPSRLRSDSR